MIQRKVIDSHVHLDLIEHFHSQRIKWLKENGCSVVSWAYFYGVDSRLKLATCFKNYAQCIRRLSAEGLECYYLVGVHPRSIPPDLKPEDINSLLLPYLDDPLCKGIGEIGLETKDTKQKEIFSAQLELGRQLGAENQITGLHTPRSDKLAVTQATLKILTDHYIDLKAKIVIDHCTVETIKSVLEAGFWAGITLSPVKTSLEELKQIISKYSHHITHIMCNTDSGRDFFEDEVRYSLTKNLDQAISQLIFRDNAARFYGI